MAGCRISASKRISPDGGLKGKLDGQFEGFDPARLASRPDLKGEVTGTINVSVSLADLTAPITPEAVTGAGTLTLAKSTVGGLEIETANLDAAYANQVGDVKQFTLTGPDVKVDASGRVALDRTTASNLKYHVEAIDLPELAKLAGQAQPEIGGTAVVDGTITGNRASLSTTGTLNGSNLSYQENSALDLNSTYTVTIPELEFAKAKVDATTKGTFIKAGAFEITELTAKTVYDQQTVAFSTNIKEKTRELDATGRVILHPDHQELHLPTLAVRTNGVEWTIKPGTEATVKYSPERVELKGVELVSADQFLSVNGTVALKGEVPSAALDVVAQRVDLQQLETLLLQDRGFVGKLDAKARVTGTMEAPTVDGHVEIHGGAFRNYKYESFIADVDYAGRRATVDATLQQTADRAHHGHGIGAGIAVLARARPASTSPRGPEDAVDLHVKSTALGLGIVQGFTDLVANVAGTLEADFRVTGSGQDPHLQGHIDIRNGAFGVPLGGVSYSGLNTRIDLTPDKVSLQSFQILDEHGEALNVAGDLAVHEKSVGAVNIRITSDNFEIIDNEIGDVGLDTTHDDLRRASSSQGRRAGESRGRTDRGRPPVDVLLRSLRDRVDPRGRVVGADGRGKRQRRRGDEGGLAQGGDVSCCSCDREQTRRGSRAPPSLFDAVELDVDLILPDNLVLRGKNIRPGGPTGAALGDINITIGGEMEVEEGAGRPGPALRHGADRPRDLRVPGAQVQPRSRRADPFRGRDRDQSVPRHFCDAVDPEHRRRSQGQDHRHPEGTGAVALEQPSTRGERHPRADRLQSSGQRARHRRALVARRHCRRNRDRLHRGAARVSRSAAPSTSTCSRSRPRPSPVIWAPASRWASRSATRRS